MFGVLHPRDKEVKFIEKSSAFDVIQHSACDYCRRKKLRCSSDGDGCARCKALGRTCTYHDPSHGRSSKARKRPSQHQFTSKPGPSRELQPIATTLNAGRGPSKEPAVIGQVNDNGDGNAERQDKHDIGVIDLDREFTSSSDFFEEFMAGPHSDSPDAALSATSPSSFGLAHDLVYKTNFAALDTPEWQYENPSQCPSSGRANASSYSSSALFSPRSMTSNTHCMALSRPSSSSFEQAPPHAVAGLVTPQSTPAKTCNCLETIVFLLEELEGSIATAEESTLDSTLASHKVVLSSASQLPACVECNTRTETLILLTFICEKLVTLCSKTVSTYLQKSQSTMDEGSQTRLHGLAFGEYEVTTKREWKYVMHALIILQLRSLAEFLGNMKRVAPSALPQSQVAKLVNGEKKIAALAEAMSEKLV